MKPKLFETISSGGLALILGLLCTAQLTAQDMLAIKGGTVLPVTGDPIKDGVVIMKGNKIEAVGAGLKIPVEAKVIDASDGYVMPGFVDPHNSAGMSQANERNANVPFLSVVDSIDPIRDYFEECRRQGVTTAAVVPGNSAMIGGQAAVLKTAGSYVDDMLLKRYAGMKLSLAPASGANRMSHYARLRKEFEKAKEELEKRQKEAKEKDKKKESEAKPDEKKPADEEKKDEPEQKPPASTATASSSTSTAAQQRKLSLDAMVKLLEREYPAFIYCGAAVDVGQALRLIKQYKIDAILVLGSQCDKAAKTLAKEKLPVVLGPTLVYWRTNPRTREDEKVVLPRVFKQAGVEFALQANLGSSSSTLGTSYFWYQAATAVKYGLSETEALKSLTLRPAQFLGIEEFVGSIEPGKEADLVILTGHPLKVDTWVDKTIVGGRVVYEREKDTKLKKLLTPEENK